MWVKKLSLGVCMCVGVCVGGGEEGKRVEGKEGEKITLSKSCQGWEREPLS